MRCYKTFLAMAVFRPTPKCQYCGKPIAKGIYKSYKGVPNFMIPYGDSFIRWEYKECKCKGARKARKEMRKQAKKLNLGDLLKRG